MAPESITDNKYNYIFNSFKLLIRCSFASDIWGLGLCVYEAMTLKYPFDESSYNNLLESIIKGIDNIDCNYSTPVKNMVLSMLIKVSFTLHFILIHI
jgi:serine/threonine protein kinase